MPIPDHGIINWSMHKRLQKVIQISSAHWWRENESDIISWMISIGHPMNPEFRNKDRPPIFLYTDEEITYFSLKWAQRRDTGWTR